MKILEIHISARHNFFGHFGLPAGEAPAVSLPEIECVAGQGLRGDRFFGYQENYKGQITFFAAEVYEDLRNHLKIYDREPGVLRRNVLTAGMDLNKLVGQDFFVQGIHFAGVAECSPCFWMNQAFGPGTEEYLRGRGGLRARILSTGILHVEK